MRTPRLEERRGAVYRDAQRPAVSKQRQHESMHKSARSAAFCCHVPPPLATESAVCVPRYEAIVSAIACVLLRVWTRIPSLELRRAQDLPD